MMGGQPAATPSQLTGRKMLLMVLGIVGGCAALIVLAVMVAALLGIKIFEALR